MDDGIFIKVLKRFRKKLKTHFFDMNYRSSQNLKLDNASFKNSSESRLFLNEKYF